MRRLNTPKKQPPFSHNKILLSGAICFLLETLVKKFSTAMIALTRIQEVQSCPLVVKYLQAQFIFGSTIDRYRYCIAFGFF